MYCNQNLFDCKTSESFAGKTTVNPTFNSNPVVHINTASLKKNFDNMLKQFLRQFKTYVGAVAKEEIFRGGQNFVQFCDVKN